MFSRALSPPLLLLSMARPTSLYEVDLAGPISCYKTKGASHTKEVAWRPGSRSMLCLTLAAVQA